mgnify:CR=1 FL=1
MTRYLAESGLQPFLDKLGFSVVGYGCMTCIGNSGNLAEEVAAAIQENDLVAAAVLSGMQCILRGMCTLYTLLSLCLDLYESTVSTISMPFFFLSFFCALNSLFSVVVLLLFFLLKTLSTGNRNFEGRIHPHTRANYLASPPLVVAYALAGTIRKDLNNEPIGIHSTSSPR